MGYPMTYQRILGRNGLKDGDYGNTPVAGFAQRTDAQDKLRLLAGDLRRLENDATDEKATCRYIAERTGLDEDTVAAVLKEFINW